MSQNETFKIKFQLLLGTLQSAKTHSSIYLETFRFWITVELYIHQDTVPQLHLNIQLHFETLWIYIISDIVILWNILWVQFSTYFFWGSPSPSRSFLICTISKNGHPQRNHNRSFLNIPEIQIPTFYNPKFCQPQLLPTLTSTPTSTSIQLHHFIYIVSHPQLIY